MGNFSIVLLVLIALVVFTIFKGVRIVPQGYKWIVQRLGKYQQTTRQVYQLAMYSLPLIHQLADQLNIAFSAQQKGVLKLYRDTEAFDAAGKGTGFINSIGVRTAIVGRSDLVALEPTLANSAVDYVGGIYYPDEETGECLDFLTALGKRFVAAGGELLSGRKVEGLTRQKGRVSGVRIGQEKIAADQVVICTGFIPAFARQYVRGQVYPVKGYSFTFDTSGESKRNIPEIPMVDDHSRIAIAPLDKRIRLAGRADFVGYDLSLDRTAQQQVLGSFKQLLPQSAEWPMIMEWAGLRPVAGNGHPVIGLSSCPGLAFNLGHGHLGWTLSCGSADLLVRKLFAEPVPDALQNEVFSQLL